MKSCELFRIAEKYDNKGQYKKADKIDKILVRLAASGEFWLMGGQAMFADGDIGDINHEGMVIETILSNYDLNYDKFYELEQQSYEQSDGNDNDVLLKELGMTDEELNAVRGHTDAREYGLKHLGWQRVNGTSIQTQTLTASDLRDIGNGLWDAYQEEAEELNYDIEVNSNHTMFWDVPWEVIATDDPAQLLPYRG